MLLKTIFIRFYKSFNYDYMRKNHPKARANEWESYRNKDLWYPYVTIPLDQKITTIVGANESGKSQLLSAIAKGITGEGIERSDFCRYSQFFTVERDEMGWPEFGFEWKLNSDDAEAIRNFVDIPPRIRSLESVLIFRTQRDSLSAFVRETEKHIECEVKDLEGLQAMFPRVFTINADVGLPESVPISFLANSHAQPSDFEKLGRQSRVDLTESLSRFSASFGTEEEKKAAVKSISDTVQGSVAADGHAFQPNRTKEIHLARTLLCEIANIDPDAFAELHEALREGKDAFVNGMIQQMNKALERRLNFPRYWSQDKDFKLLVSPREFDLVFTIRDRTGSEYAFNERSSGLKYFLSYYIQYLAY